MKFNPPLLTEGPLSGAVFVVTHGKVLPHPTIEDETMVVSSVKYDITDQFEAMGIRRGWSDSASTDAIGLARRMARERDERFEQLKAAEAEANRYRVALQEIAAHKPHASPTIIMANIAREALKNE